MKIVSDIETLRALLNEQRLQGKKISFIPTMGALHQGHLSLVEIGKMHAEISVMSIFINPTQFNNLLDLETYPRDFERDCELARSVGVDFLFAPLTEHMYPDGLACKVLAGNRSQGLCGATRPGHFDGVVTVVLKLFNIVEPDFAVFGDKDFQQVQVIEEMVDGLFLNLKIIHAPLLRDEDGVALSSRNKRLSTEQRVVARTIPEVLFDTKKKVSRGEVSSESLIAEAIESLTASGLVVDYVEIRDSKTLEPQINVNEGARMFIAVFASEVRLIDNCLLKGS